MEALGNIAQQQHTVITKHRVVTNDRLHKVIRQDSQAMLTDVQVQALPAPGGTASAEAVAR